MMKPAEIGRFFSADYGSARHRFRGAVAKAGGQLDKLEIEAKDPNGERLTIDVALFGDSCPRRVLVHSSGIHGVEGFAGSAIQLQWLAQGLPPLPADSAILIVHILNPYGMAWCRRTNENNVDLNRNFLGPDERFEGAPPGYLDIDHFLNPSTPPSKCLFYLHAGLLAFRQGPRRIKQATTGGQYVKPTGLFFGGVHYEDSTKVFQDYIVERLPAAGRVVVVDVHTGLGPFGQDHLLAEESPAESFSEIKLAFGERVQPFDVNQGVAYRVRGGQHTMYARATRSARTLYVAQEFGTCNSLMVLDALRCENWWHHYGDRSLDHPSKRRLLETFNPNSTTWRRKVLQRGAEVIAQATALAFGDARIERAK